MNKEIKTVMEAATALGRSSHGISRRYDGVFELRFDRRRDITQTVDTITHQMIDAARANNCIAAIAKAGYRDIAYGGDRALAVIEFTLEQKPGGMIDSEDL